LEARVHAKLLLVDAVEAVSCGDHDIARRRLSKACSLAPDLSCDPEIVLGVIRLSPVDPVVAPRLIATIASLWPDRGAQTARYLEGYGAIRALRARQFTAAARQARLARSWLDASFLTRTTPISIRLLRGWAHQKTARGKETAPEQQL
jgi:hypothetical protein